MILVIDNYDSFTYNLVQYLLELGADLEVFRNDEKPIEVLAKKPYQGLLLSPGPGVPDDAGMTLDAVRLFAGRIPILGVCLGHQAIAQHFGGKVVGADRLMHGKTSEVHHEGLGVFRNLPNPFQATRYHSLIVEPDTLGAELERTAWTEEGELMGIRHRSLAIEGVQFHPESFLTLEGKRLLANWLEVVNGDSAAYSAAELSEGS